MPTDFQQLLEAARQYRYTSEQKEEHRRSFAFGNTNIENSRVTREVIDRQAEILDRERATDNDRDNHDTLDGGTR